MTGVPDRVAFAVEVMAPRPGLRVLEIGCGSGVAVSLVRERIGPGGTILGIDRSATQIGRARRRIPVPGDGVELQVARFPDLSGGPFDLIYAIDVPAFRSRDPAVPAAAAALLRPDAELWVFDESPPGTTTGPISMRISALLSEAGLAIVDMVERGRTVGVLSAPLGGLHRCVGHPDRPGHEG